MSTQAIGLVSKPARVFVPVRDLLHRPWRLGAVLLISALFLTNIYRAATQSISHDEGMMFEWYLSGPWSQVLAFEHGNHHVLSDLLCKLTTSLFGLSQFSVRIPVLLGGLLYFYSVFGLSLLLFGEAFLLLLSVAVLCLNPFVLDYLTCARGYGPGLGFLFYALYQLTWYLKTAPEKPSAGVRPVWFLRKAGVSLGLSIACNPIMLFPGGALIASFLSIVIADSVFRRPEPEVIAGTSNDKKKSPVSRKERRRRSRHDASGRSSGGSWQEAFLQFAAVAVAVGGFFLVLPVQLIELEAGYMGPPTLFSALSDLVRYSFLHSPSGFAGLLAWFPAEIAIRIATYVGVPVLLVSLTVLAVSTAAQWTGKHRFDAPPLVDRFLLLITGMLLLGILLIVVSRYVFHQPYPELRTVMYWSPLLTLACLTLVRRLAEGAKLERILSVAVATALVLCVVQFITQFNTRYFAEWAYCAAGKDMMEVVRAQHAQKPGTRVKVGASWQLEPVINFYRASWGLDWMEPVVRESPANFFDYYMLGFDDTALVERLHLRPLLRDRLSRTVLAARSDL